MVPPKLFFHKREQYVSMKVLLNSGAIRKSGNGNAQMIDALVCVLKIAERKIVSSSDVQYIIISISHLANM